MVADEGERFARVPQLSQRAVDGHHQAVAARLCGTPAIPFHRPENLHRLPQGHRAQTARHARRAGVAMSTATWLTRPVSRSTPPRYSKGLIVFFFFTLCILLVEANDL